MAMEEIQSDAVPARRLRRTRSVWIVGLLTLSTTLGLLLAWAEPKATLWQFWAITQCLPVFYLLLSVWAAWPLTPQTEP
jgi:hypothetical protein